MNALTRWNPFRAWNWDPFKDLEDFERRLATTLGRTPANGTKGNGAGHENIALADGTDWMPAVDISEDEKEFLFKAELPGMKKEELKVSVADGVVTLAGERKVETEEKTKKYHRVERSYGKFERSFTLPERADASGIRAEFKDGLLEVHLPKTAKAASKALEVEVT